MCRLSGLHRLPTASCVMKCFTLDVELIARLTIRYTRSLMPGAMTSQSLPSVPSAAYSAASTTVRGSFGAMPSGRYDPYAPPRIPPPPNTSAGSSAVSKPGKINEHCLNSVPPTHNAGVRFKPSPFFRVDQAVSGIVECPGKHPAPSTPLIPFDDFLESTSSTDRKQQTLTFTLTSEQLTKVNSTTYVSVGVLGALSLTHFLQREVPASIVLYFKHVLFIRV
jgi:E3 SUMO-protein ligase PIAS1